nr:hypothetical protein [uncultured Pseudomonas sp.]
MAFYISLIIVAAAIWSACRITRRWQYQWVLGLAIIVFWFSYVVPWVVRAEAIEDEQFLDYEILLEGILYVGLGLLGDNWWRDDEPK